MPARVSESFVIMRTYPFAESDLIVSFFTRDQGKLRGVAKRARKPKSNFGSGLERLSQARVTYYQKETRELVTVTSCELIRSQFDLITDYTQASRWIIWRRLASSYCRRRKRTNGSSAYSPPCSNTCTRAVACGPR